jgi:hypothetical protein
MSHAPLTPQLTSLGCGAMTTLNARPAEDRAATRRRSTAAAGHVALSVVVDPQPVEVQPFR